MKKYFYPLIIVNMFFIWSPLTIASEHSGYISTDPKKLNQKNIEPTAGEKSMPAANYYDAHHTPASVLLLPPANTIASSSSYGPPQLKQQQVLGSKHYPDGSLLRGKDKKIFYISGNAKKHIINLHELQKYRGLPIIDVSDGILQNYENELYLDGDLIREQGRPEIFAIQQGKRKHILNIEELKAHYLGLEIHNIEKAAMLRYL